MADQKNTQKKIKKFLFDQHHFDDDSAQEEEEETLPPPPTFSEEELQAAREESYKKGREEALAESQASREQAVINYLDVIAKNFSQLFEAEDQRAALYETEAVHLAATLFDYIFPSLKEKTGLEEIRAMLSAVLEGQKDQPGIKIEVMPDYAEPVKAHLSAVIQELGVRAACEVEANIQIGEGDCRMSWQNGGAVRNTEALADKIKKELEQALADKARLSDNKETSCPVETNHE